jgi:hypothetical protein
MAKFIEQPRWTPSLRVVPHHVDFMMSCTACGYQRAIGRADLQNLAGQEDDIETIERRLRCSECHQKAGRILMGYYAGDTRFE